MDVSSWMGPGPPMQTHRHGASHPEFSQCFASTGTLAFLCHTPIQLWSLEPFTRGWALKYSGHDSSAGTAWPLMWGEGS